ncbi:hypothetical protein R1sor_014256 [Riccia sorocarpa]|uniref:Uncharacterized protein n=1 Tax=Riccia sorocarpa TaxID=122646 RepID=A0ABD3H8V2_9MARC
MPTLSPELWMSCVAPQTVTIDDVDQIFFSYVGPDRYFTSTHRTELMLMDARNSDVKVNPLHDPDMPMLEAENDYDDPDDDPDDEHDDQQMNNQTDRGKKRKWCSRTLNMSVSSQQTTQKSCDSIAAMAAEAAFESSSRSCKQI